MRCTRGSQWAVGSVAVGVVLAWTAAGFVRAAGGPMPGQAPRVARVHQELPVTRLVSERPEQVIEIEYGRFPYHEVMPPDDAPLLVWLAAYYEDIACIVVLGEDSRVDGSGTWIVTDVEAQILETLKGRRFTAGQTVSFVQQGGEIQAEGKTVRGIVTWAVPFEIGKEYLVFAGKGPTGELLVSPSGAFERVPNLHYRNLLTGEALTQVTDDPPSVELKRLRRNRR